eukprot:COSAG06_NODE_66327_length_254_cov_1.322581_2_plen_31_part_01
MTLSETIFYTALCVSADDAERARGVMMLAGG